MGRREWEKRVEVEVEVEVLQGALSLSLYFNLITIRCCKLFQGGLSEGFKVLLGEHNIHVL